MLSAPQPPDPEAGFTLVELAVAMSVLLLVLGALLTGLESLTGAAATTTGRIDRAQAAQVLVAQFQRDVRDASAFVAEPTLAAAAVAADLTEASDATHVRWSYDASTHSISRALVDDSGPHATAELTGVADGTGFAWLSADGTDLLGTAPVTPGDVAHCAAAVVLTVVMAPPAHAAPVRVTAGSGPRMPPPHEGCP